MPKYWIIDVRAGESSHYFVGPGMVQLSLKSRKPLAEGDEVSLNYWVPLFGGGYSPEKRVCRVVDVMAVGRLLFRQKIICVRLVSPSLLEQTTQVAIPSPFSPPKTPSREGN